MRIFINGRFLTQSITESQRKYPSAACFVFPSLYEGFGLPPVEAMACGCPVVASKAASIPEACGDAALYCDAENPADIAAKVSQVLHDPALRKELVEKGRRRAAELNWLICAAKTLTAIREAMRDAA